MSDRHKSYLLRLWREDLHGAGSMAWRATLQSVSDAEDRHHFSDLESLVAFLRAHVYSTSPTTPIEPTDPLEPGAIDP